MYIYIYIFLKAKTQMKVIFNYYTIGQYVHCMRSCTTVIFNCKCIFWPSWI